MKKNKIMFRVSVPVIIEKDGDGYHAFCPVFKGLHACGDTIKDAMVDARDAINLYVLSMMEHGEPIPCCTVLSRDVFYDVPKNRIRYITEDVQVPAFA
jgi:predicted RNase H-like HicB family nuclease